jgi:lipopolysaccharide biosynthesis glycosyltransferase
MEKPFRIYIGWDSREDIAFQVAKQSILDHATIPVEIIPLKQKQLRKDGVYWRSVDQLASTEFTFTRFLVPVLNDYTGWALFIDCDFVAVDDVKKLFDQRNEQYAVMCAQHDYVPKEGTKMDGQQQHMYPRKNWSSMMLINCGHPSNKGLTKEVVNNEHITGAYLHRFSWLDDSEVGKISHEWNWLVGWYKEPEDGSPKFLHYTEGGPWFKEYENCEYNYEYYKALANYKDQTINKLNSKLESLNNKIYSADDLTLSESKKKLINDFIKSIVDPNKYFYNYDIEESKKLAMGNKVAAIDSDGGVGYKNKGLEYDVYLTSFILGSGGYISDFDREATTDINTPLVIRGLGGGSQKAIKHCWDNQREFYAIDTGYLQPVGSTKKMYHRVTKNGLQYTGPIIERPFDRLSDLKFQYKRMTTGRKILICPPSEKVMSLWGQPDPETWTKQVIEELKKYTDRPIEVRLKPSRSERVTNKTIEQALADDVYCLITYNSIAATEALLNGKPAIALGPNAATALCNDDLSQIENLKKPDKDRIMAFVAHLSYCQFTQKELQNGYAWKIVNEGS